MSVVACAVLLGLFVLLLVRVRQVGFLAALVCVVFGFVLGATPAGPQVNQALSSVGGWVWEQVQAR